LIQSVCSRKAICDNQGEKDKRPCPIGEEQFNKLAVPIMEVSYIGKGRSPEVTCYVAFCGIWVAIAKI